MVVSAPSRLVSVPLVTLDETNSVRSPRLALCSSSTECRDSKIQVEIARRSSGTVLLRYRSRVQEESTYLGVPCLTMRTSTERPVTVDVGTNQVLGRIRRGWSGRCWPSSKGEERRGEFPTCGTGRLQ